MGRVLHGENGYPILTKNSDKTEPLIEEDRMGEWQSTSAGLLL